MTSPKPLIPTLRQAAGGLASNDAPDSTSLSGTCARCGFKTSFALVGSSGLTFHPGMFASLPGGQNVRLEVERVSTLLCRHCEGGVVVVEEQWIGDKRWDQAKGGGAMSWRGIYSWPIAGLQLSTDVPPQLRECFAESAAALAAGCARASAVMGRRLLEAICADKGASEATLDKSLSTLAASGVLQPTLADWSKEVRLVGNKGAHFDPIAAVTAADAAQLLSFLRELVKYLYEMPAELTRRRSGKP